jgi:hypothetical protein
MRWIANPSHLRWAGRLDATGLKKTQKMKKSRSNPAKCAYKYLILKRLEHARATK